MWKNVKRYSNFYLKGEFFAREFHFFIAFIYDSNIFLKIFLVVDDFILRDKSLLINDILLMLIWGVNIFEEQ